MTDFDKIKNYYAAFDEQHRLDNPEGRLEYEISMQLLVRYLPSTARVLDLGGGAGKYSIELAKRGYPVTLADLSEKLLSQARSEADLLKLSCLESIDCVNAVNLCSYKSDSFDSVILFGPLYHLLDEKERNCCISEISRVLKKDGLVFASFIPYISGSFGIVDRLFFARDQVNKDNLVHTFQTGQFQNNSDAGFQEGYYPRSDELQDLFRSHGFKMKLMRSIRSFGYGREEQISNLKQADISLYKILLQLIEYTAQNPAVIESCGHALYIGQLINKVN